MVNLNIQQMEAIKHKEGPLLVFAGAGSGKTRVIVNRIIYLTANYNVLPYRILAVTFTNKAANEMKERIQEGLTKEIADQIHIGTFHAMCARILRIEAENISLKRNFTIIDEGEQIARIKRAINESEIPTNAFTPKKYITVISKLKNEFQSPEELTDSLDPRERWIGKVYHHYEKELRKDFALDFDDLILKVVQMFRTNPEVLRKYQKRYRYIMIDEYQDTNAAQFQLVKLLSARHGNLMVVGDDDQSIYRWRGAQVKNILEFSKLFPGAKEIKLEQNYRSTQVILSAASDLMSHNKRRAKKRLWTKNKDGDKIQYALLEKDRNEAEFVAKHIEGLVQLGYNYRDIAVFYRINAQSRVIEEILLNHQIPHRVLGNISFFKRKEIKDLLAYIRLVLNPNDSESCRRILNVPKRGIGKKTRDVIEKKAISNSVDLISAIEECTGSNEISNYKIEKLNLFVNLIYHLIRIARTKSVQEFINELIEKTGYLEQFRDEEISESRNSVEIVEEFMNVANEYSLRNQGDLGDFADYLALNESQDGTNNFESNNSNFVSLLTLHNAKGLEFPCVFIMGLDEGFCPYYRKDEMCINEHIEEERRLLYVGMTRAKKRLFLSGVTQRFLYGQDLSVKPSRFLEEIPEKYLEIEPQQRTGLSLTGSYSNSKNQDHESTGTHKSLKKVNNALSIGDRIHHSMWGTGTILNIKGSGVASKITISFDRVGRKKLKLGMCNLNKIK